MSTRRLALAGVVAPPLFAAIVLLLTLLDWDELHDLGWSAGPFDDPDATWPSVAMLADQGFLQSLNCTMLGVATIGLAVALRRLGARLVESALVAALACFAVSLAGAPNFFAAFLAVVLVWLMLDALRCLELTRVGSEESATAAPHPAM